MREVRIESLEKDSFVEQAYLVGAMAEDRTLAGENRCLKVLSIWERRCSSSRFELGRELWQVLSEDLGKDVEPMGPTMGTKDRKEV